MPFNIITMGAPRSGKTTILEKLIANTPNRFGFITSEILNDRKERSGFEMENHLGDRIILAHTKLFEDSHRVSKYTVCLENLECMISIISSFKENDFLYLDEIGQMQLFSNDFKKLVLRFLDSPNTCIMTMASIHEDLFIEQIKKRNDIVFVEIVKKNREAKEIFLWELLSKIEKAKKYLSKPELFERIGSNEILLHSEHGPRALILQDKQWKCDCNFFDSYSICSHVMAIEEFARSNTIMV